MVPHGCDLQRLSTTTAEVAEEAMRAAKRSGAVVSYDVNVRASLWGDAAGNSRAIEVNRRLVNLCDVVFGNEKNFVEALNIEVPRPNSSREDSWASGEVAALGAVASAFPGLRVIASTVRTIHSASRNDWVASAGPTASSSQVTSCPRSRSSTGGGGDAFAAGVIFGLLEGCPLTKRSDTVWPTAPSR